MVKVLESEGGQVRFSEQVSEYVLDENMVLKAVVLKDGNRVDHTHLHEVFAPKHPLLRTPEKVRAALDQFFVHEFKDRRNVC